MDDEDKRLARVFTNATSAALFGVFDRITQVVSNQKKRFYSILLRKEK